MVTLGVRANEVVESAYPLIAGIGLGMLFHAPYQIFTKSLQSRELASGTSAFFLVRFTGATVGLVNSNCSNHDIWLTINSP